MESMIKVKCLRDESLHWYIVPNELENEFCKDLANENMIDSGGFDDKYGKFRTGGGLNNIQLYIKK
jgi:hypothetical protein